MGPQDIVRLVFLLALLAPHCCADLTSSERSSIKDGFDSASKAVESVASFGNPVKSTSFKNLAKLAGFLGAAGGFVSFVLQFLPSKDSAELSFMKKQFTQVNTKLDTITTKLDNINTLITFENQRAAYVSSSQDILLGHRELFNFIKEVKRTGCASKSACKRIRARIASRYLKYFNVKKHLEKVLRGTFSSTSVFGEPLLSLVSRTSKCNFAKINMFTNGVLKLAFKGQQVVLAYEKLTGSKKSIAQSMNDWFTNIYHLRSKSYSVKNACFKGIKQQMLRDIKNSDYQTKSPTNAAANRDVKTFIEQKYPWMNVVVFSYTAYGGHEHCTKDVYGRFWNMPKNKNARKRNIIVGIADKKGTYIRQKYDILNALDSIAKNVYFTKERRDYCKMLTKLEKELKKKNVWKYIASLNLRKNVGGFKILADNDLKYISELYHFKYLLKRKRERTIRTHVVIVLKSMEQAGRKSCSLTCKNTGKCILYPYSTSQYCECKPFYQGNLCQEHAKAELAKTVDSMLAVTLKLPVLSDVYFDIKDLRQFVGISFANMQKSISNLESSMQRKFDQLSRKVTNQFQWANFITMYKNAIQRIEYLSHRFERLPKEHKDKKGLQEGGKKLAKAALEVDTGIRKALYQLNNLLVGKVNKPVLNHKPVLLAFMESRSKAGEPCTPSYKKRVDNYWKQLLLLQQIGYMVWAQACEFAGKKSDIVSSTYANRIKKQMSAIKKGTCQYDIRNSINVHCNKHYLHPGMTIENRCKRNYYVYRSVQTSCTNKRSSCSACYCYRLGSRSQQCNNIHGKCSCKHGFYGKKCNNRNCVWHRWSPYGHCLRCGYGAKKARRRSIKVTALGSGNRCHGPVVLYAPCFKGCCRYQFHCSNRRKCIRGSYKCDYDNDCGDKQDERGCNERCYTRYTSYSSHGHGKLIFLDRHHPYCRHGESMKMFHLQTYGGNMRYQYTCCRMLKNLCYRRQQYNGFTYAVHSSKANLLVHQRVSCGPTGYISGFGLRRSSNGRSIRYEYNCCRLYYHKHRRRTSCYSGYTGWTIDGHAKSYYLNRQTVKCRNRYFLNAFQLNHKAGVWWGQGWFRYYYRCCRIIA